MERLKNKVLIIFLIVIALVLGYQMYSIAASCGIKGNGTYLKPGGLCGVPVADAYNSGMILFCREKHNSWLDNGEDVIYNCAGEVKPNDSKGYGVSYFLHKETDTDVVQNWIWANSGMSDGEEIFWQNSEWSKFFAGWKDETSSNSTENKKDNIQAVGYETAVTQNEKQCIVDLKKIVEYVKKSKIQSYDWEKDVNRNKLYKWAIDNCDEAIFLGHTDIEERKNTLVLYAMMITDTVQPSGIMTSQFMKLTSTMYAKPNNYKNFVALMEAVYEKAGSTYSDSFEDIVKQMYLATISGNPVGKQESINDTYKFVKNGLTVEEAARIYQFFMSTPILKDYANRLNIISSNAKIAVDAEQNSYIIGPFTIEYATVVLNGDTLLGLKNLDVTINDQKVDCKFITAKGTVADKNYKPKHKETFYVKISNKDINNSKKKSNEFLRETDEVKVVANFIRANEITSTIHFLTRDEKKYPENGEYNSSAPQRLMTYETKQKEGKSIIAVPAVIKPGYSTFKITKVDAENGTTLEGAEFLALLHYKNDEADINSKDDIYVNPINLYYVDNKTAEEALQKFEDDKNKPFRTSEDGIIKIENIPNKVRYNNKTYTLISLVAKEVKAPKGYLIPTNEDGSSIIYNILKNGEETHDYYVAENGIATIKNKTASADYDIILRKVDEKGNSIAGLNLLYTYRIFNGETKKYEVIEKNKSVTTDKEGIAKIDLKFDATKVLGLNSNIVYLNIKEKPSDSKYDYFKDITIYFQAERNEDGIITKHFFSNNIANIIGGEKFKLLDADVVKNIENGVYKITKLDGSVLLGKAAYEYVKTGDDAGSDVDISLKNDNLNDTYDLVLEKFDQNGESSSFLDGTKFSVRIENGNYEEKYNGEVEIRNGKATISGLKIHGENLQLFLQETNTIEGFKTAIDKERLVLLYNADKKGNIEIKWCNTSVLKPVKTKLENYKPAEVIKETIGDTEKEKISLKLGIINEAKEYAIKFKKVKQNGTILPGANFVLTEDINGKELGTAISDENGDVTFTGLTKVSKNVNDIITLYLYETSAPAGYDSTPYDKEHALKIEYVYIPGNSDPSRISKVKISQNDNKIWPQGSEERISIAKEANETGDIIFNFGEQFAIPNPTIPYKLDLFTKVDEEGKPIANVEFRVSIYDENKKPAKFNKATNANITNISCVSKEDGKVYIDNIKDYGNFYVEVKEVSAGADYKTINETLRFNYSIKEGDKKATLGTTLEILDESGNVVKTYSKQSENSTAFQDNDGNIYENLKVDHDNLYLINNKEPYYFLIEKVNDLGEAVEGVNFSAVVKQEGANKEFNVSDKVYTTSANGKTKIEGIDVYSTEENKTIIAEIIEEVPEGYKWHEYGTVIYEVTYTKYTATGEMKISGIRVFARDTENKEILLENYTQDSAVIKVTPVENSKEIAVQVKNTPVYDLPLFIKKVESNGTLSEAKTEGFEFTAYITDQNGVHLQDDVKVTLGQDGIVARNIERKVTGTNLKLVLTEKPLPNYETIPSITVVYDCEYKGLDENKKPSFMVAKKAIECNGTSVDLATVANGSVVIPWKDSHYGLIYKDENGDLILVNPLKKIIVFQKVDDKGTPIQGVKLTGHIETENGEKIKDFEVTTAGSSAIASIGDIEYRGKIKVVIEKEEWVLTEAQKAELGYTYRELKTIKNATISGIEIKEVDGKLEVDYTNCSSDNDKVKVNDALVIEVENPPLTYPLSILKTTELLSDNPTDDELSNIEKLKGVTFNVKIKAVGEEDEKAERFSGLTTNNAGIIQIPKIEKLGNELVLELEEVSSEANNTKMLEGPVYIYYKASRVDDKVVTEITRIDSKEQDANKVKLLTKEAKEKLGIDETAFAINVENPRKYTITLNKKMNLNGEITAPSGDVTFKGIITTDEAVVNEVKNLGYTDFIQKIKTYNESENLVLIDSTVTPDKKAASKLLDFYNKPVYVYFAETEVAPTMTKVEKVFFVNFVQDNLKSEIISNSEDRELLIDATDRLDINITVTNPAKPYQLKLIKVDKRTGDKLSLSDAKFKITLQELTEGKTIDLDTAYISFDKDGEILKEESQKGQYIVDMRLEEAKQNNDKENSKYIVLDVNKLSKDTELQLIVEEIKAPTNCKVLSGPITVKYTANPFADDNEMIKILEVKGADETKVSTNNNKDAGEFSLDVTIENEEEEYVLDIEKVIKENLESNKETYANDIHFGITMFDDEFNMIQATKDYEVVNGKFKTDKIAQHGTYYLAIEETIAPQEVVKLEGIHMFKVVAELDYKNQNKRIINIEYLGTGTITADNKLQPTADYQEAKVKFANNFETNADKVDIKIKNELVNQYYIDITKIAKNLDNTKKPLNGAGFSLYLTDPQVNYLDGAIWKKTLETKKEQNENGDMEDGKIRTDLLSYTGTYKLTIVEDYAPIGYDKIFDKIEVIYTTKNGKDITINSVKAYDLNKNEMNITKVIENGDKIENYTGTYNGHASIKLKIENPQNKPVPIIIKKVDREGKAISNATFTGTLYEVRDNETIKLKSFANEKTGKDGILDLGTYYVKGNLKLEITEVSVPSPYATFSKDEITLKVNDNGKIVEYTAGSVNALKSVTYENNKNILTFVDLEMIPEMYIGGFVWVDKKAGNKGEDSYNGIAEVNGQKFQVREGLFDDGEELKAGIKVVLHECDYDKKNEHIKETKITDQSGSYLFTENLSPFKKYYITFEYDGDTYESVKYLVQDGNGTEFTGNIVNKDGKVSSIVENEYWNINSKAVTNKDNNEVATTTANRKTIGNEGSIQYYPLYEKFTLNTAEGVTLYVKNDEYYTTKGDDTEKAQFKPLNPSHQKINLGIKEKERFELELKKDVQTIGIKLSTGAEMNYNLGFKPDSAMYKIEIPDADVQKLSDMEIIYKVTVNNKGVLDGKLFNIADYYNADILDFKGYVISNNPKDAYDDSKYSKTVDENSTITQKMIAEQTYTKKSGLEQEAVTTGRVIIPVNPEGTILKTNEAVTIYIKYSYKKDGDKSVLNTLKNFDIDDEYVTLGVAEIWRSQSKDGKGKDKTSIPANLTEKFESICNKDLNEFYEYIKNDYYRKLSDKVKAKELDEDAAPGAKIVKGDDQREISGTVFEDLRDKGILDDNDTLIKGVKVTLYQITTNSNGKEEQTPVGNPKYTDEKGEYSFKGVAAGNYVVEFTYGDEETVLPKQVTEGSSSTDEAVKISGKTYSRNNNKSYNALEFESTDYAEKTGVYWYEEDDNRLSDAKDVNRTKADEQLKEENSKYGIMDNEKSEMLYSYNGDIKQEKVQEYIEKLAETPAIAATPKFKVNIEKTQSESVQVIGYTKTGKPILQDGNETFLGNTNGAHDIDFGIKARPQSSVKVIKEVDNVKIYTSAGNVNVDVQYENGKPVGTAGKVQWNKGDDTLGYIWIQRSDEEITGATLEITYKITVTDESGELSKVWIADYVQNGMTYAEKDNTANGWMTTEKVGTHTIKGDFGTVAINNTIDVTNVNTILVKELDLEENKESTAKVTLTKTLNAYSETDIDAYTNYAEIIATGREGLARKDKDSIPGNYDPINNKTVTGNLGKVVTTVSEVTGLEKDSAKSKEDVMITRETGENRSTDYITLACGVIALFATGVVMIKKFAIKK